MRKILIYNDSVEFGGHESMTVEIANILSEKYETYFFFSSKKTQPMLNKKVKGFLLPFSSKLPWAAIRAFKFLDLLRLFFIMRKIAPDIVIISQGSIEFSLRGAIISKLLGYKSISYIPYAYSFAEIGVALGVLRDIINRYFFLLFHCFVTINEEQKWRILKKYHKKVLVLHNYVKFNIKKNNLRFCKEGLIRIGVIGNITFKTKGQNKVIEFSKILEDMHLNFKVILFGDGRDRKILEERIKREGLTDKVIFKGWVSDRNEIYKNVDLTVIFSNFDAFPLVSFESISYLKPVFMPAYLYISKNIVTREFHYNSLEELGEMIRDFSLYNLKYIKKTLLIGKYLAYKFSYENFERKLLKIIEEA